MSNTKWLSTPIAQVATIAIGGTPSRSVRAFWSDAENGLPWASIADLRAKHVLTTQEYISELGRASSNVKLVPPGTPIMSFKLTIGRTSIAGCELFTNEAIAAFLADESRLDPGFLFHVLPSAAGSVITDVAVKGATLNKRSLATITLNLPPLTEQRRIAEILDSIDDQIRTSNQIIVKLELTKLGLFQDLMDRTDLPLTPLAAIAVIKNGTTPSRVRKEYWENGSIPWLTSSKVNDYIVDSGSELVTPRAVSASNLRIFPPGSVVVGMIGDGKTRGMSARLRIHAAINQNLAGIIPGDSLDGEFLHHMLVHSYDRLRSGGRGSNQGALNTSLVAAFPIVVPELREQRRLADLFNTLDLRIKREQIRGRKLGIIRSGLMADLLTGRVRIPMETTS